MKRLFAVTVLLSLCIAPVLFARDFSEETLVAVEAYADEDWRILRDLDLVVSRVEANGLLAFVTSDEWETLEQLGFSVTFLRPAMLPKAADGYLSYDQIIAAVEAAAASYPDLTMLHEVGTSVNARRLLAIKISDNADTDEDEPELLFEGSTHGDEKIGYEVCLSLIDYLLSNYGSDTAVTNAVNQSEIWILPLVNPDGHVAGSRYNGSGTDINRDFGWFWEESSSSHSPSGSPESQALTRFTVAHQFVTGLSYHSGAELVNYPFDSTLARAPDDALFQHLAHVYADPGGYSIINGWDWYEIHGSSEETYYGAGGSVSMIMEISNIKAPSNIEYYTNLNLPGQMALIAQAQNGVRGTVTDAATDETLAATIWITGNGMPFWSDPELGDFHRILLPGTYTLTARTNGYQPQTVSNVVVPAAGTVEVNFELNHAKDAVSYAERVVQCERADPTNAYNNTSLPSRALGAPDHISFSLGKAGWAVVDMGPDHLVIDGEGPELTVHEGDTGAEGYEVLVGNDWIGPFASLGTGAGTGQFDLAAGGQTSIRYVKIVDDGDGSASDVTAGFELDAVEARAACDVPVADFVTSSTGGAAPFKVEFFPQIETPDGCWTSLAWDFGDGGTSDETLPVYLYREPGLYTVSLTITGPGGQSTETKEDFIEITGAGDDDDASGGDDDDDAGGDDDDDGGGCGCA